MLEPISAIRPTPAPLLHREMILARIARILDKRQNNNVILIGEPGVGKTAILEQVATTNKKQTHFFAAAELALALEHASSDQLDKIREGLEKRAPATLIFDDARILFTQTAQSAFLYFFAPLFANPKLHVIFVTGMSEYRRYVEREPALARELEMVEVTELANEDARDAVMAQVPSLIQEHQLRVHAKVASEATTLAKRYLAGRAMPDRAIRLLSDAIAMAQTSKAHELTLAHCKKCIAEQTGIPIDDLSAAEQEKLLNLEKHLDQQVIGQGHVTKAVAQVIRRSRAGLKDPTRPIASFLFLGSSGVGKTELAKVLAKNVFHNERALVRFDMSEFSEAHAVQRLVGAPPGYIGYEEGGQLTNTVLSQPYSLILLDELEKAHPKVFDIFLQVMDDGRLTDGKGRTVDFSNTVIIATSNLALEDILAGFAREEDVTQKSWYERQVLPLLSNYFRPEFLNRFDDVMVFSPFSRDIMWKIAQLELKKLEQRVESAGYHINIDQTEYKNAIERIYNPTFGARPIRRYLQDTVENRMADQILGR